MIAKIKYIKEKYLEIIILSIIFVIMIIAFLNIPYMADDYRYTGDSLYNFIKRSIWWYSNWGGRVFFDSFLSSYFFSYHNNIIWRLITPIVIFALVIGIIINGTASSVKDINKIKFYKNNFLMIILLFFLIFTLSYKTRLVTFFYATGTINYLYPITFMLYFILPYNRILMNKESKYNSKFIYAYFIFGFIAGLSTEQVSAVSFGYAFCGVILGLLYYKKKLKDCKVEMSGLLGVTIGSILFYTAPGNYVRLTKAENIWFQNLNLTSKISHLFESLYEVFIQNNYITIAIAISILYIFHKTGKNKNNNLVLKWMVSVITIALVFGKFIIFENVNWSSHINILDTMYNIFCWFYVGSIILLITYTAIVASNKYTWFPIICVISTFLTQIILLFSPLKAPRIELIGFVLLWVFLTYLLNNINYASLRYTNVFKWIYTIIVLILWINTARNYIIENDIVKQREAIIVDINQTSKEIILPAHNEKYVKGANFINQELYHVKIYKKFYNIPEHIVITIKK